MKIKTIENVWVVVDRNNNVIDGKHYLTEKKANKVAETIRYYHNPRISEHSRLPVSVQKVNINIEVVA